MTDLTMIGVTTDKQVEAMAQVDAGSFGSTIELSRQWLKTFRTHGVLRSATRDGRVVGTYLVARCSQHFGGKPVAAGAVSSVAVAIDQRRQGVAGTMMRDLINVARVEKMALAPLWAATVRLYRRWGWEVARQSTNLTVAPRVLAALSGSGQSVIDPDLERVNKLRRSIAPTYDGFFDVPPWWNDVPEFPPNLPEHRFSVGWEENGVLTGFTRFAVGAGGPTVAVYHLFAATPDALRGLLSVVGSAESMAETVEFQRITLPPTNPLGFLLPEPAASIGIHARSYWMQRIVDVPLAVSSRGWRTDVTAHAEIEVIDPVDAQPTRWTIDLDNGAGQAKAGGNGTVQIGIGALSNWYCGATSMSQLRALGLVSGPDQEIQALDSMIEPRPLWMADFF